MSKALTAAEFRAQHGDPTAWTVADFDVYQHLTDVEYREVWDSTIPPGGYVCSICGGPVESEPCPEHAPAATNGGGGRR